MESVWLVMHGDYNGTGVESVHTSYDEAVEAVIAYHVGYRPMMGGDVHEFLPVRRDDDWTVCEYVYRGVAECGFDITKHSVGRVAER